MGFTDGAITPDITGFWGYHHTGGPPKIMGKPSKSSILIGFSVFHEINHPFWGVKSPYFWVDTHTDDIGLWKFLTGQSHLISFFLSPKIRRPKSELPSGTSLILIGNPRVEPLNHIFRPSFFTRPSVSVFWFAMMILFS